MLSKVFQLLAAGLLLATTMSTHTLAADIEIVPFQYPPPEQSFYLRGGLRLQEGRITELPHQLTERTFVYCGSAVAVRAEPSVNSKRVTAINMGTHPSFEMRDDDPSNSWVGVYQDGVRIGYSAKAIKQGKRVENLFCPMDRNTSTSTFEIQDKTFTATLRDNRQFLITGQDGTILYQRKITGDTSLYELRSGGEPFGWLVGWHKYDGDRYYHAYPVDAPHPYI